MLVLIFSLLLHLLDLDLGFSHFLASMMSRCGVSVRSYIMFILFKWHVVLSTCALSISEGGAPNLPFWLSDCPAPLCCRFEPLVVRRRITQFSCCWCFWRRFCFLLAYVVHHRGPLQDHTDWPCCQNCWLSRMNGISHKSNTKQTCCTFGGVCNKGAIESPFTYSLNDA